MPACIFLLIVHLSALQFAWCQACSVLPYLLLRRAVMLIKVPPAQISLLLPANTQSIGRPCVDTMTEQSTQTSKLMTTAPCSAKSRRVSFLNT